jgi:methyltransferase-like protein
VGTLYDNILYPTAATTVSQPDNLATIATLLGMKPAPVTRCRVLELACGDANNLIPLAFHLPESRFTGIDLAEKPIAAGNDLASFLGLKNIRLEVRDLMSITPEFGEFDYIIAHGLYAWVPPPVQEKILEICRANLAPQGVAFVSYNAYPGSHFRMMARDLLHHFIQPVDPSPRTGEKAMQLLEFMKKQRPEAGRWGPMINQVAELLSSRPVNALRHDELGTEYHPLYFHEFAARAGRHGLQFLAEAEHTDLNTDWLSAEELEMLGGLKGDPVILKEQYLDFLKVRPFRMTLLCRKECVLQRGVQDDAVLGLLASSNLQPVTRPPDLESEAKETFRNPDGASYSIHIPPAKKLLARLAEQWPRPIPVAELVGPDSPATVVANFLYDLYSMNLLALRTHWLPYVHPAGERPQASMLVRKQIHRGLDHVTSQEHKTIRFFDKVTRELVSRLDGTRTRAELLAEMLTLDPRVTPETLDASLKTLSSVALMTA